MCSIMTMYAITLPNNCQKTEGRVPRQNKISAHHLIQAVRLKQCDAFPVLILKFKNYKCRMDVHLKLNGELKYMGSASSPLDVKYSTSNKKRAWLKNYVSCIFCVIKIGLWLDMHRIHFPQKSEQPKKKVSSPCKVYSWNFWVGRLNGSCVLHEN